MWRVATFITASIRMIRDGAANIRTLFEAHSKAVRKHISSIVNRFDIAEELMQEAFVRLLSAKRTHLESPRGFLFRTAQNLALDHVRRARRVSIFQLDDQPADFFADKTPSAEETLAAREELAFMRAVLLELPPKCRQAFLLVRLEELSHREAAEELGISPTMVRKYLARAITHISMRTGGRL
jgi:RNA polymerase sigma-70 factor (ECF subfamily)